MKDWTPENLRCEDSLTCPSVRQLDNGDLLIVGKRLAAHEVAMAAKAGIFHADDEFPIIISPEYLSDYIATAVAEAAAGGYERGRTEEAAAWNLERKA